MKECKMLRTRSDVIVCVLTSLVVHFASLSFHLHKTENTIHVSYGFLLISFPLVCSFCECHVRRDWASVVVVCVSVSFCLFHFPLSHITELKQWRLTNVRRRRTTLILISLLKSELDTFIRCALHVRFLNEFSLELKLDGGHLYNFYIRCFSLVVFWWNSTCRTCTKKKRFPCK